MDDIIILIKIFHEQQAKLLFSKINVKYLYNINNMYNLNDIYADYKIYTYLKYT